MDPIGPEGPSIIDPCGFLCGVSPFKSIGHVLRMPWWLSLELPAGLRYPTGNEFVS